jgi:ubiquinone/menaquinone biosynthesis C-methylase UbiE
MTNTDLHQALADALWKIYRRAERPRPWTLGDNFIWRDPDFTGRILREHLDELDGAASRVSAERTVQIEWLWQKLGLRAGDHLFDVTCGPGLYAVEFARRGCLVTGLDINPEAIAHAHDLALSEGVAGRCHFVEQDVRHLEAYRGANFDAALLLYGQLSAFTRQEATRLLAAIAESLRPGGKLCLEILNQDWVDKQENSWWFTDDTGLWGDGPFLHLGERFWYEAEEISVERYYIIHLETGQTHEVLLNDQTYSIETMQSMLRQAGFHSPDFHEDWDGLPLYDAEEWVVYVATRL